MIIRRSHWLAAFAVSAVVHFAAAHMMNERETVVAMERSAGTVTVIQGSLFDSIDAEHAQEAADPSQTIEPVETAEQPDGVPPAVRVSAPEHAGVDTIPPATTAEIIRPETAETVVPADPVPRDRKALSALEARSATGIVTGSVAADQVTTAAVERVSPASPQEVPVAKKADPAAQKAREIADVADAETAEAAMPAEVEILVAKSLNVEAAAPTEAVAAAQSDAETVTARPERPLPAPNPLTRQERERLTASLQPPHQAPKKQKTSNRTAGQDRKTRQDRDTAASRKGSAESRTAAVNRNAGDGGRSDGGGRSDLKNYYGELFSRIRRAKRRPASSSRAGGLAIVRFTVFATGRISAPVVIRSSGHASFDDAARAAVSKAAPFPPIPASAGKSKLVLRVEMKF